LEELSQQLVILNLNFVNNSQASYLRSRETIMQVVCCLPAFEIKCLTKKKRKLVNQIDTL